MTKSQIDRLGERLKAGNFADADLRLLDLYRRSFAEPYHSVLRVIREQLPEDLDLTGRPAKSTTSIVDKLRRESIRLSQIQDIAGCRVIVPDAHAQGVLASVLSEAFSRASIMDRRKRPSHGYRAVHIIVISGGKPVEMKMRTPLQHLWAEVCEKLADTVDPAIKYGGGPEGIVFRLSHISSLVAEMDETDEELFGRIRNLPEEDALPPDLQEETSKVRRIQDEARRVISQTLREMIE